QQAVLVAQFADTAQISLGRNDDASGALHRFHNDGGDGLRPLPLDNLPHAVDGATAVARTGTGAAAIAVRRFRPKKPFRERSTHLPERGDARGRSEEHTSELQSRENLVCRLLLEKKKS